MKKINLIILLSLFVRLVAAQDLDSLFQHPPASAKPWVFWYWMHASVTKEGITADLQAMKEAGIGGAYLMPIKGKRNPPFIDPPVEQLSPEWWDMVRFARQEAGRLGLQLGMHVSDGFALAGGPWITPEHSMQKVVWTTTHVKGNMLFNDTLPQPPTHLNYYKDIAILAWPSRPEQVQTPVVSSSLPDKPAGFLAVPGNKETFRSEGPCWIQYTYAAPFTCYAVTIRTNGTNYQSHRLMITVSDDGVHFRPAGKLTPARHGWQDSEAPVTHAITPVTARYFRFSYDKEGSEPGAEDLDAAKWKQSLKIAGIELSGYPRIHQFEGKSAAIWRISPYTQLPDTACIPLNKVINLTGKMDSKGRLNWKVPAGNWTILRIGHTSTGHTNATGGAGSGLECDKFDPVAVRTQFEHWFGEAFKRVGEEQPAKVLTTFHVDSWECGSQNWSASFRKAFKSRRGYDPLKYLPAMAGYPVQNAMASEEFLHDVRLTITELVQQNFYDTLAALAHARGCTFSAESMAPVMPGDGMLHYRTADIPMGEYWLRSPTHDKPNDMLDAISGAHIYGKQVVQAEAFTELRMGWDEHPGMLKTLADRNYALGINKLVYHVFTHNPWMDRRPGMTLDGVGLYFQRDQTWWKPGKAWVEYAQRCQAMLQQGRPVADIAVFTGEEIPRRSILPERLVPVLPGIFGEDAVNRETSRLANRGGPLREMPAGVTASANIADPADWTDPLHGYAYDSFNADALLQLATVRDSMITLPGGASYKMLVLPGVMAMSPEGNLFSLKTINRLKELVKDGATILVNGPVRLRDRPDSTIILDNTIKGPWSQASFNTLGITPDFLAKENGQKAAKIAWTHRAGQGFDTWFISNQQEMERSLELSFRITGKTPEIWDPVTGEQRIADNWSSSNGRTTMPLQLPPNGAVFVIFRKPATIPANAGPNHATYTTLQTLDAPWKVFFDNAKDPVIFEKLADWSKHASTQVRYYSGTATYRKTLSWPSKLSGRIFLDLGKVANLAAVKVNGIDCGIAWTPPYQVEVTNALKQGSNTIEIAVTNTWANRLTGDQLLPDTARNTYTTAPYRLDKNKLLPAGLLGPVTLKKDDGVPTAVMQDIYNTVRTPHKYGLVMVPSDNSRKMDCPSIFRRNGKWYMVYIVYDGRGYETWLADSKDLLNWDVKGKLMSFSDTASTWDSNQKAGYIALQDYQWGGNYEWQPYKGKYWMSYIGGGDKGYEKGLLSIGMAATTKDITTAHEWDRLKKPVLMATDSNARWWENNTIYKSSIIHDPAKTTGYPFVMYYNAKGDSLHPARGKERIGMAVSDDMEHWIRYGKDPVLDHFTGITGDAVIQKINDVWVMFYFGAFWKNRPGAFNRFACSYDLVHWTDWQGEDLVGSTETFDARFAHKSFVISHNGIVYHFYCAVNDKDQRGIAVATSADLGKSKLNFTEK